MQGLIGRKVGMTQVFTADGNLVPVTVIEAGPCVVVQKKEREGEGYSALQLGFGQKKSQRVNKPLRGHMGKTEKGPFQVLREFRVDEPAAYQVGQEIRVSDLFTEGDRVDVTGTSKGRGFSGVIKRWGFSGFPASHGTHESFPAFRGHREPILSWSGL